MTTTFPLSLPPARDLFDVAGLALMQKLPDVRLVPQSGPVLHSTPLASAEVLSLNVARGCGHGGGFCAVRASRHYPGDETLTVYADTAERLAEELASGVRPRAVFVSPDTDPFPPLNEVQRVTAAVVQTLARHGVEAWLMTRGLIRPAALEVLAAHRDRVKVTVVLTTLDRQLQRTLEPLTASPHVRLRQIARLRQLGIAVQVALDPLIPGVTDTRANLSALLAELAEVGVRQVTAGYLFLRQGLADGLAVSGLGEAVLESFRGGPILAAARYLPKARRQRGYASLMALAAGHGIQVSVSALSNPDFAPPRRPSAEERQPRLRALFAQATLRREPA